jgi:TRAP-type transport system small permease protein
MKKFWRAVDVINRVLLTVSSVMVIVLMLIGAFDVIGRYLLNAPIKGALGISEILLVGIVFLAWPYTQSQDGNVKVEMFYDKFSAGTKKVVGIIRSVIALVVFVVMTWQTVNKGLESMDSGEIIDVLAIPAYPFHFIVTVGVGFLCLQLLVDFMKNCQAVRGE